MKAVFSIISILSLFLDVRAIDVATHIPENVGQILNDTRRIINGWKVTEGKPYMVYLRLPKSNHKMQSYRMWLCGGVIVHEEYIITSAACIEDAEHFYIVSGTYKYSPDDDKFSNPCIKNGAKKAIWKCVPKNYVFDGHENDNIRWMNNDIAVVKVEDGFDFERRVRGCDFVPKPIPYNNQSKALENPGNIALVTGWGSISKYSEMSTRRSEDQRDLLQSRVEIIQKNRCKRRWGGRYYNIIDNYMICTKDLGQTMSEICNEKYVDCQDINYSDDDMGNRRFDLVDKVPTNLVLHSAHNDRNETSLNETSRRRGKDEPADGGFCENDHGGPLIYGHGAQAVVIGIISACLVKERTNKCYGPFLYTSIYKNRQFISCAIYKDVETKCRRQFRSGETHTEKVISWKDHEDGPAVNEMDHHVKNDDKYEPLVSPEPNAVNVATTVKSEDKVNSNRGYVVRATEEKKTNTNSTV